MRYDSSFKILIIRTDQENINQNKSGLSGILATRGRVQGLILPPRFLLISYSYVIKLITRSTQNEIRYFDTINLFRFLGKSNRFLYHGEIRLKSKLCFMFNF